MILSWEKLYIMVWKITGDIPEWKWRCMELIGYWSAIGEVYGRYYDYNSDKYMRKKIVTEVKYLTYFEKNRYYHYWRKRTGKIINTGKRFNKNEPKPAW